MIDEVITAAAEVFDIDRAELLGRGQRRAVVWARQAAALVAYDLGRQSHGLGVEAIGQALGRDHTTITHARAAAMDRACAMPQYAALLAELYQAV